jgi:hypothetical protein
MMGGVRVITAILVGALICFSSCTAIQPIRSGEEDAFLELLVVPETAEVYIDDEYQGMVNRWAGQIVPVQIGYRRLELRAEGYLTQRFDLDVAAGTMHTLRVRLEPESHLGPGLEGEADQEDPW